MYLCPLLYIHCEASYNWNPLTVPDDMTQQRAVLLMSSQALTVTVPDDLPSKGCAVILTVSIVSGSYCLMIWPSKGSSTDCHCVWWSGPAKALALTATVWWSGPAKALALTATVWWSGPAKALALTVTESDDLAQQRLCCNTNSKHRQWIILPDDLAQQRL